MTVANGLEVLLRLLMSLKVELGLLLELRAFHTLRYHDLVVAFVFIGRLILGLD